MKSGEKRAIQSFIRKIAKMYCVETLIEELFEKESRERPFSSLLPKAAEILGCTEETLLLRNKEEAMKWYDRYEAFKMNAQWQRALYNRTWEQQEKNFLHMLLGSELTEEEIESEIEGNRTDRVQEVMHRCIEEMKKINQVFPGTFDLNRLDRFFFSTESFADYEDVYAFMDRIEEIENRFEQLFFAAMRRPLEQEEAQEFNLISAFLNARDLGLISNRISYPYLRDYGNAIFDEKLHDISDYVMFRAYPNFWKAFQFYKDPQIVREYILNHPDKKSVIRQFVEDVTNYSCTWSYEMPEEYSRAYIRDEDDDWYDVDEALDEELEAKYGKSISENILIKKTADEIDGVNWILASEKPSEKIECVRDLLKSESINGIAGKYKTDEAIIRVTIDRYSKGVPQNYE